MDGRFPHTSKPPLGYTASGHITPPPCSTMRSSSVPGTDVTPPRILMNDAERQEAKIKAQLQLDNRRLEAENLYLKNVMQAMRQFISLSGMPPNAALTGSAMKEIGPALKSTDSPSCSFEQWDFSNMDTAAGGESGVSDINMGSGGISARKQLSSCSPVCDSESGLEGYLSDSTDVTCPPTRNIIDKEAPATDSVSEESSSYFGDISTSVPDTVIKGKRILRRINRIRNRFNKKKNPSTNEKNPSTNEENPSTNEKNPSTNEKNPSTNEKNPSTNEKNPSTKEKNPSIKCLKDKDATFDSSITETDSNSSSYSDVKIPTPSKEYNSVESDRLNNKPPFASKKDKKFKKSIKKNRKRKMKRRKRCMNLTTELTASKLGNKHILITSDRVDGKRDQSTSDVLKYGDSKDLKCMESRVKNLSLDEKLSTKVTETDSRMNVDPCTYSLMKESNELDSCLQCLSSTDETEPKVSKYDTILESVKLKNQILVRYINDHGTDVSLNNKPGTSVSDSKTTHNDKDLLATNTPEKELSISNDKDKYDSPTKLMLNLELSRGEEVSFTEASNQIMHPKSNEVANLPSANKKESLIYKSDDISNDLRTCDGKLNILKSDSNHKEVSENQMDEKGFNLICNDKNTQFAHRSVENLSEYESNGVRREGKHIPDNATEVDVASRCTIDENKQSTSNPSDEIMDSRFIDDENVQLVDELKQKIPGLVSNDKQNVPSCDMLEDTQNSISDDLEKNSVAGKSESPVRKSGPLSELDRRAWMDRRKSHSFRELPSRTAECLNEESSEDQENKPPQGISKKRKKDSLSSGMEEPETKKPHSD